MGAAVQFPPMNKDLQKPKIGDLIDVEILDAGEGNQSFARLENGMGGFIRGVHVPGDHVQARVAKVKKRHVELSYVKLLSPSACRIDAPCSLFGRCGGCRWQQVQYERSLEFKQKTVQAALERLGGFQHIGVEPVRPSESVYAYRNKIDLVFSRNRAEETKDGQWSLGFHVQGAGNAVLDVESCHLVSSEMNRLAERVRIFVQARGWQAFDLSKRAGLLRSLMIRQSHHTGQLMVNLVTSGPIPNPMALVDELEGDESIRVDTIVNSIATRKNRIAIDTSVILSGAGTIEENFCGLNFTVSPSSFLQPHTVQANQLYQEVIQCAGLRETDRVLDLYCGIGTLTLLLAKQAQHVFGAESVQDAVDDAWENAALNGIENVEFRREILGRSGEPEFPSEVDVIVTDPPRDGMEEGVVSAIRRSRARRVVYVSCHPASLARDAKRLCAEGHFQLKRAIPFDLFPQTAHIETLAVFDRC